MGVNLNKSNDDIALPVKIDSSDFEMIILDYHTGKSLAKQSIEL